MSIIPLLTPDPNDLDLSDRTVQASPPQSIRRSMQAIYELPFRLQGEGRQALVVGAGTGNDVAAALRLGYSQVVSVDIDARILRLGSDLHPERPYADPRVRCVANDARAYFEPLLSKLGFRLIGSWTA